MISFRQASGSSGYSMEYDDPCTSSSSNSMAFSSTAFFSGTRRTIRVNFDMSSTAAACMLFKLLILILLLCPTLASCSRLVHDKERNLSVGTVSKLQERHLQDEKEHHGRVVFKRKPGYTNISDNDKSRRDLRSGLGSSPPQCNSKCGRCTPCKAVHVPIQPGLIRTTEYYPEAWRCKCGNKLYMP